jgi:hypothetical protein
MRKLDSFDMDLIRRVVYEFFDSGRFVSMKTLQSELLVVHELEVSISTLRRALRKMGFRYVKYIEMKLSKFYLEQTNLDAVSYFLYAFLDFYILLNTIFLS